MAEAFAVEFNLGSEFEALMTKLPNEIAIKAMEQGTRAAAKPIADLASTLAPDGNIPKKGKLGSSQRQSKWYKRTYNNEPLRIKIKFAIRKYRNQVAAFIGAKYPDGNEVYPLLAGHKFVRWTKTKKVSGYVEKLQDNFLKRAFFEQKSQIGQIALDKAGAVIQREMAVKHG